MSPETPPIVGDQSAEALKRELAQAREQHTTFAEILKVISSSPMDPRGVFAAIATSAARLCDAYDAAIHRVDGNLLHLVAHHGPIPGPSTLPLTAGFVIGRAVLDQRTVHVCDAQTAADQYPEESDRAKAIGFRTILAVPLIRAGKAIGVISLRRREGRALADRQIELLQTFADQVLIAIENTRLFEAEQTRTRELTERTQELAQRTQELTEARQYQTATSDVLGVIAASATDIQPVLQTLVESACGLCEAFDAIILLREGDWLQVKANHGPIPINIAKRKITRDWVNGRCVADRVQIHVQDLQAEVAEYPQGAALAQRLGARTILSTPLMREGEAIGAIMIRRDEVRPFSDKQIGLLETFARQAVIAIENTRLFEDVQARTRELSVALQRQTATSEILGIISASPGKLKPVFDAILERARDLCAARFGHLLLFDGQTLRPAALHNVPPAYAEFWHNAPPRAFPGTLVWRLRETKRPYQLEDTRLGEAYRARVPLAVATVELAGARTLLGVPMVKDDQVIGAIVLYRTEVRLFDEQQVALLSSFADQAVIAIENARLLEELQTRQRELETRTQELEIASQHKSQFVANMSHELRTPLAAILGYAELMQEGFYEAQGPKSLDALTRIRSNGKHLLGLINTVLDIAKIESGQFKLNLTEYALDNVVETVTAATESLAQSKKLALKTDVAKSLPIGVGDEQRLTQVLLNLVGNAIKFTDAGEVRVTAGAENGQFTLSVSDTGAGIPAGEHERIFEKFRQVDSSNTRAKGGTGLGLAIAREIVEMHGGRIWVESAPGQGSTFRMELPVHAAPGAGAG